MALDRGRWPPPPLPLPPELTELRRARELALALVECGTGKSRSARLRLVPMHSLLPLSPLRALSRPGPPSLPPRSLDLSLLFSFSRSLVPSHGYAALALHLYALDASSYSSLPPSSFSIYIWHKYTLQTKISSPFPLPFPLALFFHFQIPSCLPRGRTREFARLSSLLSPSHLFPPSRRLRTWVYVRTCTLARTIDVILYPPLSLSFSFFFADPYSRARPNPCANILASLSRNQTVLPRPVLRLPSTSRWTRFFNRAELRRGEESLVMAS